MMNKIDMEEINKIMEDGKQAIELTYDIIKIIEEKQISFEALGMFIDSMVKSYKEEKEKRK
ncbi:hypothetical protein KNV66_gp46 [Bacillus phage DLc1]|uniref:Uncharacterized protein n=1 Tax=Bacillus phage DLc1 TaxID=2777318 RepID=A0A7M1RPC4_9CAUD|nr:hypothetical protein KNV66_gp46 [Bacillus phage DLc1]QOR56257.1 hypothetical protein [Bacillus phage DLc1]